MQLTCYGDRGSAIAMCWAAMILYQNTHQSMDHLKRGNPRQMDGSCLGVHDEPLAKPSGTSTMGSLGEYKKLNPWVIVNLRTDSHRSAKLPRIKQLMSGIIDIGKSGLNLEMCD